MPLLVVIVNPPPRYGTKDQEIARVARALALAAESILQPGDGSTSGGIVDEGNAVLGSWSLQL